MRVLIIIPTYNERDNIGPLVAQIHAALPVADVLVVDDGSPDGTGQLVDELMVSDSRLRVLHRSGKLGLGTAYLAGFRFALDNGYDYIFEMDADFSHDPCYLPALLAAAVEGDPSGATGSGPGADVVIGSRRVPGGGTENWGIGRQLISAGGSLYARLILGVGRPEHPLGLPVHDLTSGFKCFRRRVLQSIDLDSVHSEGYSFQIELTYRALGHGFRVAEVPIIFVDRRAGQSKMSSRIFLEALGVVWRLRLQGT
jgi:dolichol-phosphate mannosyltransferase